MGDARAATLTLAIEMLGARDPAPLAPVLADNARWYGRGPGGGCRSRDDILRTLGDTFEHGPRIELADASLVSGHAVLHVRLSGGGWREGEDAWYLLVLGDDGLVSEIAVYASIASVEHDLAIRAAGAVATDAGAPPAVSALVPFVHVVDIARSVAFYRDLGFTVVDTFEPDGELAWAFLESDGARLMLARASAPIDHHAQAVLFYLYARDLDGLRDHLVAVGASPGEIFDGTPGPKREMRVADPDGYVLMIAQIEPDT